MTKRTKLTILTILALIITVAICRILFKPPHIPSQAELYTPPKWERVKLDGRE